MDHATGPAQPRTGGRIAPLCQVDYGHRPHCSPGPVMVGDTVVIPQWCFCPCHDEEAGR
ncbi:hypothetical protein [Streptomyces cinereoruber]|uniref:hypothetical protein n=1 Tax=Streptomyces cinereoruber TaxID=67260 RepID=UPI003666B8CD